MKHLTLLLTCISFFQQIYAQSTDFAPLGAKWYYTEESYAPPRITPFIVEVVAKEMYAGKLCSKITSSKFHPSTSLPEPCYLYTQNDTVFFYSEMTNRFEMLYDFTATVGSAWVIGGLIATDPPFVSDTIVVDSLSSIIVNGASLKVWHIHSNTNTIDWGNRIIEKMGNDALFAPRYGFFHIPVWGLRCFETPGMEYHLVPYACDTVYWTTSTSAPEYADKIKIMPSPFQEMISVTLELSLDNAQISLYNSAGVQVLTQNVSFGTTQINTERLPAGIYFYTIVEKGLVVQRGKAMKTDGRR